MSSADEDKVDKKAVADEDDKKEPPLKGLDPLQGLDIGKILSSKGPVVKCVLLKHLRADGKDAKPHPASPGADATHHRQVLTDLIEEIELDTTPAKNGVSQVLGGSFTFIGQFITEGTVLMVRKELPDDETLENESIKTLQSLCKDFNVDTEGMLEKSELVGALLDAQLVVNPHRLQPPLDGIVVRGDILILKVAETDEELDSDGVDAETLERLAVPTNEEFFLNYTRDEYIAFASRTDVVAPQIEAREEEDGEEEENDDEDEDDENGDEEYQLDEDEEAEGDEDYMTAMMNLILGEVLKKFRQENGRGPDTRELLELRSKVAEKLGVEVASFDEVSEVTSGQKREAEDEAEVHSHKKVKFSSPKEDDDQNIKASGEEKGGEKKDS
jgi:hypothetical protein